MLSEQVGERPKVSSYFQLGPVWDEEEMDTCMYMYRWWRAGGGAGNGKDTPRANVLASVPKIEGVVVGNLTSTC